MLAPASPRAISSLLPLPPSSLPLPLFPFPSSPFLSFRPSPSLLPRFLATSIVTLYLELTRGNRLGFVLGMRGIRRGCGGDALRWRGDDGGGERQHDAPPRGAVGAAERRPLRDDQRAGHQGREDHHRRREAHLQRERSGEGLRRRDQLPQGGHPGGKRREPDSAESGGARAPVRRSAKRGIATGKVCWQREGRWVRTRAGLCANARAGLWAHSWDSISANARGAVGLLRSRAFPRFPALYPPFPPRTARFRAFPPLPAPSRPFPLLPGPFLPFPALSCPSRPFPPSFLRFPSNLTFGLARSLTALCRSRSSMCRHAARCL